MRLVRDGYIGIAPVPGDRVNVGIVLGGSWRNEVVRRGARAVADELIAAVPPADDDPAAWRSGVPTDAVAGAWPIGHRVVRRAGPGWLLVGDAAGFLDPFTGEGLHRALVSAELAAAAIDARRARSPDSLRGLRPGDASPVPCQGRRLVAGPGVPRPARPVRIRRPPDRVAAAGPCDDGPRDGRPDPRRSSARPALPRRAARAMTETEPRRTRVAAYALVTDDDGRILLCRTAPASSPNRSGLLPGGGLEFGESPRRRSCASSRRNPGWSATADRLVDVSDRIMPNVDGAERTHAIRIVYRVADHRRRPARRARRLHRHVRLAHARRRRAG